MKINRFIGGPGRSNTRILGLLLGESDATVLHEPSVIWRLYRLKHEFNLNKTHSGKTILNRCVAVFQEKNGWEIINFRRFVFSELDQSLNPFQLHNDVIKLKNKIEIDLDSFQDNPTRIVDIFIEQVLEWIGNKKFILKIPGIEIYLASSLTLSQEQSNEWRIIYTTRNIFDMAASWFRDQMMINETYDDLFNRFETKLINSIKSIKMLPKTSIMLITDEELFKDTKNIIKKSADFLDIKLTDTKMKYYDPNKRHYGQSKNDPVVSRYEKRISDLQNHANVLFGQNVW